MSRRSKIPKFTVREITEDEVSSYTLPLSLNTSERQVSNPHEQATPARELEGLHVPAPINEEVIAEVVSSTATKHGCWTPLRKDLLNVHFDMLEERTSKCASCSEEFSGHFHVRCRDCGVQTYYCSVECCRQHHQPDRNPFHKPLLWEGLQNKYTDLYLGIEFSRSNHTCATQQSRHGIQVYDPLGRTHTVSVVTCGCEKDVVTFFRHGLWASSIDQPKVAFHVELLNTIEFLMLEGKVSLHAFCQSMKWRNNLTVSQCQRLYSCLRGEPMEQYRHLRYLTRTLTFLDISEDNAEEMWNCIACPKSVEVAFNFVGLQLNEGKAKTILLYVPNTSSVHTPKGIALPWAYIPDSFHDRNAQACNVSNMYITWGSFHLENGNVFVSLDANFGLVRKKGKDATPHEPNHKNAMFVDLPGGKQPEVETVMSQECSNFQAGSVLRSKTRNSKLDVTGVFGAACRHGVPVAFMDMNQGERLHLSETMMDHLLTKLNGQDMKLHIIYDIACLLHAHLKAKGDTRYADISFAVPSFHAYGHKASCQVQYSTRWQSGYGLTDGEVMERLWSFLRRFAFISREMTPSNRIDLLTDALMHYRRKKYAEMDHMLVHNLQKANTVLSTTTDELRKSMDALSVSVEQVDDLVKIHKEMLANSSNKGSPHTKEEIYVQLLLRYSELEGNVASVLDSDKQEEYKEQMTRLKKELSSLESKIGVKRRWSKTGQKFKIHHRSLQKKRKIQLLHKMHDNAVEYEFIVNLKGKYAGERNQKIVQRLQKQIQRASKALTRLTRQYNQAGFSSTSGGIQDEIQVKDVLKPDSQIYNHIYGTQHNSIVDNVSISSATRHRVAELRNRQLRAMEEQEMTRNEMISMLSNLAAKHANIMETLRNVSTHVIKGVQVALTKQLEDAATNYHRARAVFSNVLSELPGIPDHLSSDNVSSLIDQLVDQNMSYLSSSDSELSDFEVDTEEEDYDSIADV